MKRNNSIKALIFLFVIVSSFAINAYNSFRQNSSGNDISTKTVQFIAPTNSGLTSDAIIFEELENENDSEDFLSDAFLILPFHDLAFDSFVHKTFFSLKNHPSQAIEPIFISIHSIRI